jgi:4'-phosphopantetheinyl transferase EntD
VAQDRDVLASGLDAEPDEALPPGLLDMVSLPSERARLPGAPGICWDRLLFSAKESVYKAWFPLTRQWLGFHDVDIALSAGGTFGARLLVPPPLINGLPLPGFSGRWLSARGLVLTAITVTA